MGSNGIIGYHNVGKEKGIGVVTGRSGTIGKVRLVTVEEYWPHNTALFVKDFKGNNPVFVKYLLESLDLKSLGDNVSSIPSLDRKLAHKLRVKIPPVKIQEQIVREIEAVKEIVDSNKDLITIFEQKIQDKIAEVWSE